ncbi:MAG: 50S ribosomal protein L3 [Candidatus Nanoarchaeia archaeon]|nr:50S ribosomal protein L3 [Candidatus Nanoarchaeia archaeon]
MGKRHRPRRGSLQFWPRARAARPFAKIRNWSHDLKDIKLLGFAGYKTGMTHVLRQETNPKSHQKDMKVQEAITIIECPPIKPLAIRFYQKTADGSKVLSQILSKKINKEVSRSIVLPKKSSEPSSFDDLRLVVYTQPHLTGIGKKKPEIFELGISGEDKLKKLEFAKSMLEKDIINITDVFKEAQYVDVHSVTKGKGFQGTVKRYGVPIRQHKSEKTKRGIGNLGSWTPKRVQYSVPQAGKMGFHLRTEYNKKIYKINSKPEEINPKGGFVNYGLIKNPYVLVKGSFPGPRKRLILFTDTMRLNKKSTHPIDLTYISQESKQ